jgi:hypothetical protein
MGEVQLVQGDQAAASTVTGPDFVEVVVDATGVNAVVPAEWVGHPVLGAGITPVEPDPVVDVEEVGTPPTSRSTTAELEAYAEKAGIDLGEASTNAERLEVIEAAIAEAQAAEVAVGDGSVVDPDVQLVAGDEHTASFYPAQNAEPTADTTDPDGTESSDENPPSGEEN